MPPLTDEQTRRNVIKQWILGFSRDTIAEHYGIGAGTVSNIVANYKVGLEELDFDSIRQLAVEAAFLSRNFICLLIVCSLSGFCLLVFLEKVENLSRMIYDSSVIFSCCFLLYSMYSSIEAIHSGVIIASYLSFLDSGYTVRNPIPF